MTVEGGGGTGRRRWSADGRRARVVLMVAVAGLVVLAGQAPPSAAAEPPGPPDAPAAAAIPAAPATAAPGARTFTLVGAGDILLHPGLWAEGRRAAAAAHRDGYYFDPIFASAVPDISGADIAICHMETPYGDADGPFTGYPVFEVPPQIAQTIHDIGYDSCSTASNHSLDGGLAGVERELDALDAAGVKHTGSARNPAEAAAVDMLDVRGIKVAQLSYAYGFNGIPRPKGEDWIANLISLPDILAAAHRAKQAGADVVILSLHWGTEYQPAPNDQQLTLARQLLASPDIDLILGCHAHVVQPMARIGDKWVAYGMGNQVATQPFSLPTQDGVLPRFTFTEVAPHHFVVTKAEAIPTYVNLDRPIRLIDLPRALAEADLSPALRARYLASWKRTAKVVGSLGAAADGLTVVGGD